VDVPGEKLPSDLPGYLRTSVAPEVPESLRAAFLAAVDGGRIRTMQNKQLPAKPMHQPGALLLGDAFNMRHPLTGGGMTVALSDCNLLCGLLQPLPSFQDAIATATSTAEFYTRRKPLSATINTLANALYKARPACGRRRRRRRGALGPAAAAGAAAAPGLACALSRASALAPARCCRSRAQGDARARAWRSLLCCCSASLLFGLPLTPASLHPSLLVNNRSSATRGTRRTRRCGRRASITWRWAASTPPGPSLS
jgi:hypothetical protein